MQGAGKSAVKRPTADLPEQGEERPSSSLRPSGWRLPLWPKQQDHEHITSLQGATQAEERIKLLQSLAAMQLGEVREGRRLPGAALHAQRVLPPLSFVSHSSCNAPTT